MIFTCNLTPIHTINSLKIGFTSFLFVLFIYKRRPPLPLYLSTHLTLYIGSCFIHCNCIKYWKLRHYEKLTFLSSYFYAFYSIYNYFLFQSLYLSHTHSLSLFFLSISLFLSLSLCLLYPLLSLSIYLCYSPSHTHTYTYICSCTHVFVCIYFKTILLVHSIRHETSAKSALLNGTYFIAWLLHSHVVNQVKLTSVQSYSLRQPQRK